MFNGLTAAIYNSVTGKINPIKDQLEGRCAVRTAIKINPQKATRNEPLNSYTFV
jgi:hypothetical protein